MTALFDMRDRKVLITGGGTGLGKGFAKIFIEHGADVMLSARREDKLKSTAEELNQLQGEHFGRASYVVMDVSKPDSIKAAYAKIDTWGCVDVLINNAGIIDDKGILEVNVDDWDFVQDVNLKGPLLLAKEMVRRVVDKQNNNESIDACIINISSILGVGNLTHSSAYGASKAALNHLTRSMAVEWAKYGIRANAIAPGYIDTDMAEDYISSTFGQRLLKQVPQRRFGQVDEVSGAVLMLASPAASYITGVVLPVDGGHSLIKLI